MRDNLVFPEEMVQRCIATESEMEAAKLHGEKVEYKDVFGSVTAYAWNGKIYVVEMNVIPEARYR